MDQNIPLAVLLTLVTTVIFAAAAVIQHQAVGKQSIDDAANATMSGGQLLALIRSPRWWLGMGLIGAGAAITVVALMMAPLTVVQSLAVLAMPWTVLLAERVHGHRVSPAMWRAVALTVAGTAWFAVVAVKYAAPTSELDDTRLIGGVLVGFTISGLFALSGARGQRAILRCVAWAASGAVIHGLEAGVVKAVGEIITSRDWLASVLFWAMIVTLVVGSITATAFIQQGYANGPPEIVMGTTNAVSPVAAVAFGILVLREGANMTWLAAVMMVAAGAIAVYGVVLLARFHPATDSAEAM